MTSTGTETSTVPLPSANSSNPPEITVLTRIGSIPLISSLNDTLSTNAYTRSPYTRVLGLSNSAYKLTEPIQAQFGSLIVRADGIANAAVDIVEKQFPSAFTATPDDVKKNVDEYVRERRESAGVIATDIDKRFVPIVDYLEAAVNRLDSNAKENNLSNRNPSLLQYQRTLELTTRLRDQLQLYSNEQMKQLQAHSALVQRATETARSFGTTASSSLVNVSDTMIAELGKLQTQAASLSASLQASASKTLQDPAAQLPVQIRQRYSELASALQGQASSASATYAELSNNLASTVADLRGIMTENVSIQEKASRITHAVSVRVQPLLEALRRNVQQSRERSDSGPNGTSS